MGTRKSTREKDNLLIGNRIKAGIIDLILVSMVSGHLRVMIGYFLKHYFAVDWFSVPSTLESLIGIIIIAFVAMLEVLIFSGSSVGKKAMNLEIRRKDGNKISRIKIYIRRFLTLYLWALNVIIYIVADQTLCDILFNTEIVEKASK